MISLLQICFSVQYLKTQKTNKKAIQQLLTITTQENLRQLEYTTFLKIVPKFNANFEAISYLYQNNDFIYS